MPGLLPCKPELITMQVNAFLQKLRDETAASHCALEQNERSSKMMSAQVTLADYTGYLERMYGFIHGFEIHVFPRLTHPVVDLSQREKTASIMADLQALYIDISTLAVTGEDVFERLYPSVAAAMAGLYVVEGSTLGGMIINRHVRQVLGNQIEKGNRYFSVYGAETSTRWKAFLEQLNATALETGMEEEMIRAAKDSFTFLEGWMRISSV